MACRTVGGAIVCSRGERKQQCAFCWRSHTKLCDQDLGNGKTCDAPMCATHSYCPPGSGMVNIDFCPLHKHLHVPRGGESVT